MKNIFIALLAVCAVIYTIRLFKRSANFAHAPGEIAVTRIELGGTVVRETLQPRLTPYLALYHGAGWCGPCQRFSPILAEFYRSVDKSRRRFQLVMVNYDHSEGEMLAYMRQHHMGFPAVMRGSAGAWAKSTGEGIPNLMIVDTATGKVVSSSFDGETYVGSQVPLDFLKKIAR